MQRQAVDAVEHNTVRTKRIIESLQSLIDCINFVVEVNVSRSGEVSVRSDRLNIRLIHFLSQCENGILQSLNGISNAFFPLFLIEAICDIFVFEDVSILSQLEALAQEVTILIVSITFIEGILVGVQHVELVRVSQNAITVNHKLTQIQVEVHSVDNLTFLLIYYRFTIKHCRSPQTLQSCLQTSPLCFKCQIVVGCVDIGLDSLQQRINLHEGGVGLLLQVFISLQCLSHDGRVSLQCRVNLLVDISIEDDAKNSCCSRASSTSCFTP